MSIPAHWDVPPGFADPDTEEGRLLRRLDPRRMPRHVAVIMDGNGRWARTHGRPRVAGHRAGVDAVRETVEAAARLRVEVLTLFAFSHENWKRPRPEVDALMRLLREYVDRELDSLVDNDIRLHVIGRPEELPASVRKVVDRAVAATAGNGGLALNVALSYGGRQEIVDACRAAMRAGARPDEIDEASLSRYLGTAGQPDPDLLIRTSGEMRVSNFLLWQIAYTEIWVTDTHWPDFRRRHLFEALADFQRRERRFGDVGAEAPVGGAAAARG